MFLLDDILLSPLKGLIFIAAKIAEEIDREQHDETTVLKQLLEVQLLYEMDEISEEEYETREAELMTKLQRIREQAQKLADEEEEEEEEELELEQEQEQEEEQQGGG